jgi:hypothetical protein
LSSSSSASWKRPVIVAMMLPSMYDEKVERGRPSRSVSATNRAYWSR